MSKSLRSRPMLFCLEEKGDYSEHADPRAQLSKLLSKRIGVIFYSGVRSLRALLIGQCVPICAILRNLTNSTPFSKAASASQVCSEVCKDVVARRK